MQQKPMTKTLMSWGFHFPPFFFHFVDQNFLSFFFLSLHLLSLFVCACLFFVCYFTPSVCIFALLLSIFSFFVRRFVRACTFKIKNVGSGLKSTHKMSAFCTSLYFWYVLEQDSLSSFSWSRSFGFLCC